MNHERCARRYRIERGAEPCETPAAVAVAVPAGELPRAGTNRRRTALEPPGLPAAAGGRRSQSTRRLRSCPPYPPRTLPGAQNPRSVRLELAEENQPAAAAESLSPAVHQTKIQ